MTRNRSGGVLVVVLLLISLLGATTGDVRGATATEVSIRPANQRINVDNTITYDIVVESVENGIESYEFDVAVGDTETASITDVSLQGSEPGETGTSVTWGEDNGSLSVAVASGGHDQGVIASITIEGETTGGTGLYLSDVVVGDADFTSYSITGVNDAVVRVEGPRDGEHDRRKRDAVLQSGQTFWTGQGLLFNGSAIIKKKGAAQTDRNFQVREVTDTNQVGGLEQTFSLDQNGTRILRTTRLDGDYVITYNSKVVQINSDGVGSVLNNSSTQNIQTASWEVQRQSLSAKFDEDDLPVRSGETATIEIDSNRGSYILNISANGLNAEELRDIFDQPESRNSIKYIDTREDVIGIAMSGDETIEASFFDEVGSYEFMFTAADSTATDFAAVSINKTNINLTFGGNRVFREQTGDNVSITIYLQDTKEAWVFIGGNEVNFLERVKLRDDNDDGTVRLWMNTFTVHKQEEDAYRVSDDDKLVGVTQFAGENVSDHQSLTSLPITPQNEINRPIEAGVYDLRVASNAGVEITSGRVIVEGKRDSGVIDLTERETTSIQTFVLPRETRGINDLETLLANATERRIVALSDRLLVQVNASGLYGYLENDKLRSLFRNGLEMQIEQTNVPPNRQRAGIELLDDSTQFYTDPKTNQFFVVLDLWTVDSRTKRPIKDGQVHEVAFTVYGGGDEIPEIPAGRTDTNPYIDAGKSEEVTTTVTFENSEVEFTHRVNDTLELPARNDIVVRGQTNIAPNSKLTVRLRSTEQYPLRREKPTTVTKNGSFTASFDMASVPIGTEFEAIVYQAGTKLKTADGIVVNRVGTPTPTPTATPPPTPAPKIETVVITKIQSPAPSPTPKERTVVRTREITRIVTRTRKPTTSPGQPGFGVVISGIAILVITILLVNQRRT